MMLPVENTQVVPTEDTCLADVPKMLCLIRDTTNPQWQTCNITINLPSNYTCRSLCDEVSKQANYEANSFELVWMRGGQDSGDEVLLNDKGEMTILDLGLIAGNKRNYLQIRDKDGQQPISIPTDSQDVSSEPTTSLIGGATATSLESSATYNTSPPEYSYSSYSAVFKQDTGFVGLVNQAMTCYLNSLLQSLYMTPEFRNALYRWVFDGNGGFGEDTKSIPYQLQRLFVQMQTSDKKSVETTDVTRSFGWDSTEAWQQHDVQELCRVMFDALETKFKDTEQADLINQLYQGKMNDYVKCLECGYESARTDSFLDIPLTIRPFGSNQSYGSLEKALHAFVQPETLEGSNQYFCEKCNKKCDAHKGLKFLKFPYLLTLQLKRFDFDYSTMHRIKLNDQMTFPEILDLSQFITEDHQNKSDAESNTDSGAENEDSCHSNNSSDCQEDGVDEGIDIEQSASGETNHQPTNQCTYELFSIMVHSGSAAGGHYYAYIKSFTDGQWYCFNDQHVSPITQDDIRKTYGGAVGSHRGYYLSAYSSSTNAYMLLYRQVKSDKNKAFMEESDFPPHIKNLVKQFKQQEEEERRQREIDRNTCKIKLFGFHPVRNRMLEKRLEVHRDKTLQEATEIAYRLLDLDDVLPLEQCRLVKYDEFHDSLEKSYEGEEQTCIGTLLGGVKSSYSFDLLMETRRPEQTFQVYKPGGVTVKVFEVDIAADVILPPITVRAYQLQSVQKFKQLLCEVTGKTKGTMRVVLERYYNDLRLLTSTDKTLKDEGFFRSNKVFIECGDEDDVHLPFLKSRLFELIDRYAHTIRVYVSLPAPPQDHQLADETVVAKPTDTKTLEEQLERVDVHNDINHTADSNTGVTPGHDPGQPEPRGQGCSDPGQAMEHQGQGDIQKDDDSVRTNAIATTENSQCQGHAHVQDGEKTASNTVLPNTGGTQGQSAAEKLTTSVQETDSETTTTTECIVNNTQTPSSNTGKTEDTFSIPQTENWEDDSRNNTDVNNTVTSVSASCDSSVSASGDNSTSTSTEPLGATCDKCGKEGEGNAQQENSVGTVDQRHGDVAATSDNEMRNRKNSKTKKKWYIKVEKCTEDDTVLVVYVDKRITLGAIKKSLEPYTGRTSQNFKVYRVYPNNQEFECIRLNENLSSFSDDTRIAIRLGRALEKGEYRVKIHQLLVNNPEPCKFLFEWIFARGMTVLASKEQIVEELRKSYDMDVPIDRCRFRKKTWKNPGTIFLDDQIYEDDIPVFPNWEIFVQVLDEPEKLKSMSDLSLFVKRWRPSELKFDPFQEITTVANATITELKQKISAVSEIPVENIEFAKGRGTFPCELSVLDVQTELEWEPQVATLNVCPLYICDDGQVVYYRDSREELKDLSDDERKEIQKRENARWVNSGQRITYSPKKEKALKIYTDSSPPQRHSAQDD
ncbi:ubiquitin carboxyl-terminal hydrolase 47-like [Glandiceps talaboti]